MLKWVTATLLGLTAGAALAQGYQTFSQSDAETHRRAWTLANWDDGGELSRYVFLNMPEFWAHSLINRRGAVRPLPLALRDDVAQFMTSTDQGRHSLTEYLGMSTVDGLIVVHEGAVVFEAYPRMAAHDKHLYMSVSKVFASALVGILEDRELIDVAQTMGHYLPEVAGSGWEDVTVLDVLDMASGIDCRQTIDGVYEDPTTCYYQYEAALGWLPATEETADDPHDYARQLAARRPAGEAFEYTSLNTFMLRWLLERVTGKPYAELIAAELWAAIGAESDALLVAPKRGVPVAASGMSSTLRDLARFGLLFTPAGRNGMTPLISEAQLEKIQTRGRPELFRAADQGVRRVDGEAVRHNSYQWDFVMADGDFFKGGYGGQGLYVSPRRDLVIAFFGTMNADGSGHELTRIARQLAKSELFDDAPSTAVSPNDSNNDSPGGRSAQSASLR